jgi:hypothetical protein
MSRVQNLARPDPDFSSHDREEMLSLPKSLLQKTLLGTKGSLQKRAVSLWSTLWGEWYPSSVLLMRVMRRCGDVYLPVGGSKGGREVAGLLSCHRCPGSAPSRGGRSEYPSLSGSMRNFSDVGFFPFAFGEALWRWQCSDPSCCAL